MTTPRARLAVPLALAAALLGPAPASADPGDLRWSAVIDPGPGNDLPLRTVQSIDRVHVSLLSASDAGGGGWWVRSHDAASGAFAWEDHDDAPGRDVALALAERGGVLVAAGVRDDLTPRWWARAYDAATGAILWEDDADGRTGAPTQVLLAGRRVVLFGWTPLVPGGVHVGVLRVLDARSGALVWERADLPGSPLRAAQRGTRIYAWLDSGGGHLAVAHALADGRPLRPGAAPLPFGAAGSLRPGSFLVHGRHLLATASVSGLSRARLLDARTGALAWDASGPSHTLVGGGDGDYRALFAGRRLLLTGFYEPTGGTAFGLQHELSAQSGAVVSTTPLATVVPFAAARRGRRLWLAGASAAGDDLVLQGLDLRSGATVALDRYDAGGDEAAIGLDVSSRSMVVAGIQGSSPDTAALLRVYETR